MPGPNTVNFLHVMYDFTTSVKSLHIWKMLVYPDLFGCCLLYFLSSDKILFQIRGPELDTVLQLLYRQTIMALYDGSLIFNPFLIPPAPQTFMQPPIFKPTLGGTQ